MHVFILLLLTTTVTLMVHCFEITNCMRRVCYFYNKAQKRSTAEVKFVPEDIDPTLCTHIIYYGAMQRDNDIVPTEWNDESTETLKGNYEKVTDLKKQDLSVLLAVDGKECNSKLFYRMASREKSRLKFAQNVVNYLRKHNFDGVDLRCVFSDKKSFIAEAKNALTDTVKGLREAIDKEDTDSQKLLLTVTVHGEKAIDNNCYDVPSLSESADWINLWAVDLHGDWYNYTGHHSPLYPELTGPAANYSVDTAVQHWIKEGARKDKLVIVLPSYGGSFILTSDNTDIGAPSTSGSIGPYSRLPGRLANYEICELMENPGVKLLYLRQQRVPYLVSNKTWVGYDDVSSLEKKVAFLKKRRLGGFAFVWLDTDDFKGTFCKKGPYPLLKAIINKCNN